MPMKLRLRKRCLLHLKSVLIKMGIDLQIDPSYVKYAVRRLHQEGIAFVTKTLPAFAKYTLFCCEKQKIVDCRELGFTNFELYRGAPRFMRGLLLEAVSGCANALYRIRQFCEYFYKAVFEPTDSELRKAEQKYLATDKLFSREIIDWQYVEYVRRTIHSLFPGLVKCVPTDLFSNVRPHDGPGSFAGSQRVVRNSGYSVGAFKKLPTGVIGSHPKHLSPFSGYFKAYPSSDEILQEVLSEKSAELLFVPKDSRGPRTISKEPYHLLKAQMSFGKAIARILESESRGRLGFTDQTVNQEVARVSSTTREYATLDLKDASDRIWLLVCRRLFRDISVLRYAINHLRSTHVFLPYEKRYYRLNKLANMGSGICFPILALVVWSSAVTTVSRVLRISLKEAALLVFDYGDDLAVPSDCADAVKSDLKRLGLAVNSDKSYVEGYFRESCGADYYHGVDVAPVRFRLPDGGLQTVASHRNGVLPIESDSGLNQLEKHCRELVDNRLMNTANYLYSRLERRLGDLPFVARDSVFLGRYDPRIDSFGETTQKAYYPNTIKEVTNDACPFKGLGQSFSSSNGLGQDWCLTPLRHQILLKRKVPEPHELGCWGLPQHPGELGFIGGPKTYVPSWGTVIQAYHDHTRNKVLSFISYAIVTVTNKLL